MSETILSPSLSHNWRLWRSKEWYNLMRTLHYLGKIFLEGDFVTQETTDSDGLESLRKERSQAASLSSGKEIPLLPGLTLWKPDSRWKALRLTAPYYSTLCREWSWVFIGQGQSLHCQQVLSALGGLTSMLLSVEHTTGYIVPHSSESIKLRQFP